MNSLPKIALGFLLLSVASGYWVGSTLGASDCNSNSIDDALDISSGSSSDCNADGIPDECPVPLVRFLAAENILGGYDASLVGVADLDNNGVMDVVAASFRLKEAVGCSGRRSRSMKCWRS